MIKNRLEHCLNQQASGSTGSAGLRSRCLLLSRSAMPVAIAGLLMMSGGIATAQMADANSLDMNEAVRIAVQTHPSIRGAGEQILQANEGVEAARAGYKPQITGGIESQYKTYRDSSYDSRQVFTARLTGSQMLYDFGKVSGATSKAKSGVRVSEAQAHLATDDIAMATAQTWLDAHLQNEMLQITRDHLIAVMSITALVTERVSKGATSRSDMEQANSRVNAVRSQLLGAEAEAQRASLALMYLTGRTMPVTIEGSIPAPLGNSACASGTERDTAAVRLAEARRDEAHADLSIAKAERLPTVSLDGSVGYALTDGSRLYGEYRTTGQVGVNVSMPLYQGGGAQARERGAYYQLRAFEEGVQQARLEMRQGFANARAQADGWAEREPVLKARVDSINETRDLYRQQYLHLGTRSLLDLLNSEQEYFSAQVEQAQAAHSRHQLALQCLFYTDRLRDVFGIDETDAMNTGGTAW